MTTNSNTRASGNRGNLNNGTNRSRTNRGSNGNSANNFMNGNGNLGASGNRGSTRRNRLARAFPYTRSWGQGIRQLWKENFRRNGNPPAAVIMATLASLGLPFTAAANLTKLLAQETRNQVRKLRNTKRNATNARNYYRV